MQVKFKKIIKNVNYDYEFFEKAVIIMYKIASVCILTDEKWCDLGKKFF